MFEILRNSRQFYPLIRRHLRVLGELGLELPLLCHHVGMLLAHHLADLAEQRGRPLRIEHLRLNIVENLARVQLQLVDLGLEVFNSRLLSRLQRGQDKFEADLRNQRIDLIVLRGDVQLELFLQQLRLLANELEALDARSHVVDLLTERLKLLECVLLFKFSALMEALNLGLANRNVLDAVALGYVHGPAEGLGLLHNAGF